MGTPCAPPRGARAGERCKSRARREPRGGGFVRRRRWEGSRPWHVGVTRPQTVPNVPQSTSEAAGPARLLCCCRPGLAGFSLRWDLFVSGVFGVSRLAQSPAPPAVTLSGQGCGMRHHISSRAGELQSGGGKPMERLRRASCPSLQRLFGKMGSRASTVPHHSSCSTTEPLILTCLQEERAPSAPRHPQGLPCPSV